ncbi:acyltransferase 3 [Mycena amicta]|nr:acyltransferase 3 [Mycena amicta]
MSGDPEGELAALLPRLIRDSRIHFIDNLRSALIALVILHHTAVPFGGIGSWHYISPYPSSRASKALLSLFVALNQTFFMGTLFFLAGHFSSIAVERKTWRAFCADKLKRLGIPVVAYMIAIHPIVLVLVQLARRGSVWSTLTNYYLHLQDGVRGPIWFIAVLLVFDLVYVTIKTCVPPFKFVPSSASQYRAAAFLGITVVIISSFFIRIRYPVGRTLWPLSLQLAYTPQYVFAYLSGTCLSKIQQYLLVSHPERALFLAYLGAIASVSLVGGIGALIGVNDGYGGGMNLFALFYAVWNELCFYFIGTAWFSWFHDGDRTIRRWSTTARYSYGAYIVHAVVVVSLQILVDGAMGELDGILKAIIIGPPAVVISWAACWVLVKIPPVGKII